MKNDASTSFWQYDKNYWFSTLHSGETGISNAQALHLLSDLKSKQKKTSPLKKDILLFVRQFTNPLMLLLMGAVLLSAFFGDLADVAIILFIVVTSGTLSFFQERNAGKIVSKLQSLLSLKSTVIRDNSIIEIFSSDIVYGDVIILNAGDIIPADCLVIKANELHVNEASLTGESFPVRKDEGTLPAETPLALRVNCLWEGTNVVSGKGHGLVINTGEQSIFGEIVRSASATVETSFEKGLKDFGYFLMKITLFLSIFILVINLINEKNIVESTLFALALAVGMAPELLPAITTIAMSAGARRMLEKKVIVKKLSSIQNLGEVNLLCTDKTGTLTEGVITVDSILDAEGNTSDFTARLAFLNAFFETGYSNPIDEALKTMKISSTGNAKKTGEIPYDFIRKRISISICEDNRYRMITKGAFEQIATICTTVRTSDGNIKNFSEYHDRLASDYQKYGLNGFRVIALSYKDVSAEGIKKEDEAEMTFAGLILLQDPVKEGIMDTLTGLKNLRVGLKIITGDNKNVACAIGKSIGIDNPTVMTGKEMLSISTEALRQRVKNTHIFSEIEPQQKERIILALRKTYTVAYLGDGINDVSALNAADIGVSVNNAVDAAREAADIVLMEKNLSVLIDGIYEGRKTFANTLKYIYISTGSTFGNMFSVAAASLILPFLPMLPKQILITNFISDFPYMMIASDNVDDDQLKTPGKWNLKIINRYMVIFGIHSSIFDIATFLILLYFLKAGESVFQTGWFIESVLSELFILFIIRTHKSFFKSQPGKYLYVMSIFGLICTIALPYLPFAENIGLVPLSWQQLSVMFIIVFFYIITADILKVWFFKKYSSVKG